MKILRTLALLLLPLGLAAQQPYLGPNPPPYVTLASTDYVYVYRAQNYGPPMPLGWQPLWAAVTAGGGGGGGVAGFTFTPNATGFSIAAGTTSKTLKVDNTLELAGTDSTKMTFPGASDTVAGLG